MSKITMSKQTVSTLSEHVFPSIAFGEALSKTSEVPQIDALRSEITASLYLEIALIFNVAFLPAWFASIIIMLPLKYENLPELNKTILNIVLIAAVSIEIARMYMGHFLNLKENIPGLAGFCMISLLLQAPLQVLLLHPALGPSVVECVVQVIMCAMLAVQLVSGFSALRTIAKHSSNVFYASQFFADRENRSKADRY